MWHGQAAILGRPGSRIDLAIASIASADSGLVFSAQLLDQTQEHDSRRRLEVAHKLTDATLDTAACIIVVIDDAGTIVRINAATKEITGYGENTLLGSRLWESPLAALTRAETEAMFVWPNRSGFPMLRERLAYSADGEPIRLVWNNNVVRDETGAPSYAVLTGVDVTSERSSTGLMAHLLQASIATALIGVDVSGRITVFSAGAAHMLGTTAEEMIGTPFVSILDPSQLLVRTGAVGDREAFLCLVGMIGHGEESMARDWTWRTRSGSDLIVSMTFSVTDDDVEDRVGFLCVGRDVTEQREGQETLVAALDKERTAVERLRALDRAKDEFVSTVSHELRTPVTSILGYTELLLDGEVVAPHPQQAGMLETIARNSHRLIAICNDLLLLSGFESREVLANRETYDLREAVGVAEDFARQPAPTGPLTITFTRARRAGDGLRRPQPARPGADQPGQQRHQVHRRRRHGRHPALPRRRARRDHLASATTAWASTRTTTSWSSSASTAPTAPRRWPSPAPASACRSSPASSMPTAAPSPSTPPPGSGTTFTVQIPVVA